MKKSTKKILEWLRVNKYEPLNHERCWWGVKTIREYNRSLHFTTVHHALRELVDLGMIEHRPGAGYRIAR